MISQTEKAVILLLRPSYVDVPNVTAILRKQEERLTQFCRKQRLKVLTSSDISKNDIELASLSNTLLKEANQRITYVFEEYSQTRIFKPKAFVDFNNKVIQAIKWATIKRSPNFEPARLLLLIKKELSCEERTVIEETANVSVTRTKH